MYPSILKIFRRELVETIKDYTRRIAEEMGVCGLMNMQYAIERRQGICTGGKSDELPVPFHWYPRYVTYQMVQTGNPDHDK